MISQILQVIGLIAAITGSVFAISIMLGVIEINVVFEKDDDAA